VLLRLLALALLSIGMRKPTFGLATRRQLSVQIMASSKYDDATVMEMIVNGTVPQLVREALLSLKEERDAAVLKGERDAAKLKEERDAAKLNAAVLKGERDVATLKGERDVAELQTVVKDAMMATAALNPRAVLEYIETAHMPPDYHEKRLPRKEKWERFLSEKEIGKILLGCLKEIPDWDSPKKISQHLSNIYSLASQHAHSTSSIIAADPSKPILIMGNMLPQTLKAMVCIGQVFDLKFDSEV